MTADALKQEASDTAVVALDAEQEPGEEIDEEYNDDAADVRLISSDGIVFKVYSYFLMAMR